MAPRATITTPELEAGIAFEELPLQESLSRMSILSDTNMTTTY
jgi:hypothetical protein